ncbi:MAG: tRNA (adenosine(37)-N6)-threonylcarbamoyltransferase complex ATPase subunit type 1 TsaE [Patescibacteria group bacterium]|nr:tRNA (adenosine(37)-N6)-threonylcarbamoyltransferase complex ATPase subunit type 1 TsaE [Patescibacteria group bacterium]
MKHFQSNSLEETQKIAADWLAHIHKRQERNGAMTNFEKDEAFLVGLSGHLGAGKTAFVKCLAKSLGVSEEITSPTFVLMKIYETADKIFPRLVHIDAYRLERPEELEALKFENLMADPNNLIMVEWPENVELKRFMPQENLHFEIKDGTHTISVSSATMHA